MEFRVSIDVKHIAQAENTRNRPGPDRQGNKRREIGEQKTRKGGQRMEAKMITQHAENEIRDVG